MSTATATKPGTAGPSPWDAPPVLDGPSFAPPRTARDEAHAIAVVRQDEAHRRAEARRRQQEAQHAYTEAVRHAEATQLRRQLTRVRHRRNQAQPLLRDAVVGGVAVATPLMLFASGNAVRKELRELTAVAAAIAGVVAAREWMHHQHERRVEKLEAEAERLDMRVRPTDGNPRHHGHQSAVEDRHETCDLESVKQPDREASWRPAQSNISLPSCRGSHLHGGSGRKPGSAAHRVGRVGWTATPCS